MQSTRIGGTVKQATLLNLVSPDKRLSSFDFAAVPSVSKAQVTALAEGSEWLDRGANVLLFGPPGGGKSPLVCALGQRPLQVGRSTAQQPSASVGQGNGDERRPAAAGQREHCKSLAEQGMAAVRDCHGGRHQPVEISGNSKCSATRP